MSKLHETSGNVSGDLHDKPLEGSFQGTLTPLEIDGGVEEKPLGLAQQKLAGAAIGDSLSKDRPTLGRAVDSGIDSILNGTDVEGLRTSVGSVLDGISAIDTNSDSSDIFAGLGIDAANDVPEPKSAIPTESNVAAALGTEDVTAPREAIETGGFDISQLGVEDDPTPVETLPRTGQEQKEADFETVDAALDALARRLDATITSYEIRLRQGTEALKEAFDQLRRNPERKNTISSLDELLGILSDGSLAEKFDEGTRVFLNTPVVRGELEQRAVGSALDETDQEQEDTLRILEASLRSEFEGFDTAAKDAVTAGKELRAVLEGPAALDSNEIVPLIERLGRSRELPLILKSRILQVIDKTKTAR